MYTEPQHFKSTFFCVSTAGTTIHPWLLPSSHPTHQPIWKSPWFFLQCLSPAVSLQLLCNSFSQCWLQSCLTVNAIHGHRSASLHPFLLLLKPQYTLHLVQSKSPASLGLWFVYELKRKTLDIGKKVLFNLDSGYPLYTTNLPHPSFPSLYHTFLLFCGLFRSVWGLWKYFVCFPSSFLCIISPCFQILS